MPTMQRTLASDPKLAKGDGLAQSPATGIKRGTRAQALEIIFATALEMGEGFRHGVLGMPRKGKTYHLQNVVEEALALGIADWALIHDMKKPEPQYQGTVREDVEDFRAAPPGPDESPVIVFHSPEFAHSKETVENVSLCALEMARHRESSLVVADELYQALKARQHWAGPSYGELLREGSSKKISTAWTTQIPQALPTDALDLTETVALFAMKGRSITYAIAQFSLPEEIRPVLKGLKTGEFLLITDDDWDRTIYGPR